ncbi:hypothetical protein [Clostridium sp. DL1XJH146]
MNDLLFQKIIDSLEEICAEKEISKINKLHVTVNKNSSITLDSLKEEMYTNIPQLLNNQLMIIVDNLDIGGIPAIINSIEGE